MVRYNGNCANTSDPEWTKDRLHWPSHLWRPLVTAENAAEPTGTNNQANRAWVAENPGDEDAPYAAVCSEVAVQSAKPKTLESVVNMQLGETDGNRMLIQGLSLLVAISGLMVALDMIRTHKHSKSWTLEIVLVTDGESDFDQDEYEQVMELLDNLGIKLEVVYVLL